MFEQLQDRLGIILRNLRGLGKITEKNISETSREIRRALLEADVNYKVVKEFVFQVAEKAQGTLVLKSVAPGQQFIKIIKDELTTLLGEKESGIRFSEKPPTIILMAGLQGSGKTTTSVKLANLFKSEGKNPYLVAADVYRPAAIEQLEILGKQIGVPVWSEYGRDPEYICKNGIENAVLKNHDIVILDTAGRLHVDGEMMEEIIEISEITHPHEILFVVDGMTGQDAVNSAEAFSQALKLTGTILTKMDGDARGGAALSIVSITGKPIKFIGTSEKMEGLEVFHPERMAGRILGMGDVVSIVEKAQKVVDESEAEQMAEKLRRNEFTFDDFKNQLRQIQKMGSLNQLIGMIPGMSKMAKGFHFDEKQFKWTEAIINSMTLEERQNKIIINGSRRKRIAMGSGRSVQEVNSLLKQFRQMHSMMKNLPNMQSSRMMRQFQGLIN